MCACITGWVRDDTVTDRHNMQPKSCEEYTRALEDIIRSLDLTADSGRLAVLQQAFGRKREEPAPDDPERALLI